MADADLLGRSADLVPDALLLIRLDGMVLDCNQAARRLTPGMQPGVSLFDLVADTPDSAQRTLRLWARSGQPLMGALTFNGHSGPVSYRCRGRRAYRESGDGGLETGEPVVEVHATSQHGAVQSALITDRFAALSREMTYRQRSAAERERLLVAEQRVRDRMQRLYRLSIALASSSTLAEIAAVVRQEAAASMDGITAVLGLFPEEVLPSFRQPWQAQETRAWLDLDSDQGSVLAVAARSDEPTLITKPARPLAPFSAKARCDHVAYCVPLALQGRRLGVVAVAMLEQSAAARVEHEHAISVAAQVAQAVSRARLFEHEHHLAEWLQRSLLPTLPVIPQLSVATRYLPNTESVRVGGDWYDLFELGPGQVGLAIGDVAGHSLAEATVMAQLQNALRALSMDHREPGETLRQLNKFTHAMLPAALATACYLTLDTRTGWLRYAIAGHMPPLLSTADGATRLLHVTHGPALGAIPDACYPRASVQMAPGDTLLLYTDGLVEQRGDSLDTSLNRLLAKVRHAAGLDPEALCAHLIQDQPGANWQDDRALLAVRLERTSLSRERTRMAKDGIPEILAEQRLGHEEPGMRGLNAHVTARMHDLKAALQAPGRPPCANRRPPAPGPPHGTLPEVQPLRDNLAPAPGA